MKKLKDNTLGRMLTAWAMILVVVLGGGLQAFAAVAADTTQGPEDWRPGARVVLSSYTAVSEKIGDDEIVTFRLLLKNESTKVAATNILISYRDNNNLLIPAYGSANQFFIAEIPPNQIVEKEITLTSGSSLPKNMTVLNFTADYYDYIGHTISTFLIGTFLSQSLDALQVVSIETTGLTNAAGEVPVQLVILNRTEFPLRNVTFNANVTTEQSLPQTFPIGDIAANGRVVTQISMTLPEKRIQQVLGALSYEDTAGVAISSKETSYTIYWYQDIASGTAGMYQQDGIMGIFGGNRWKALVLIVLIVAVIGLLIYITIKKRVR